MEKKYYNWLDEILHHPPYLHQLVKILIKHIPTSTARAPRRQAQLQSQNQMTHQPPNLVNCSGSVHCQSMAANNVTSSMMSILNSSWFPGVGNHNSDYYYYDDFYDGVNNSYYMYNYNYDYANQGDWLEELYRIMRESQMQINIGLTVFLALIFIFGLAGNILVLTVFSRCKVKQASSVLIMALASNDLIICAVVLPGALLKEWAVPFQWDALCRGWEWLRCATIPLSSLILVVVAVDRYVLICRVGQLRPISTKRAKIIILLTALISVCHGIPPMLRVGVYQKEADPQEGTMYLGLCLSNDIMVGKTLIDRYWVAMTVEFVLVLITVVVLYCLVFRTVYKQNKKWARVKKSTKHGGDTGQETSRKNGFEDGTTEEEQRTNHRGLAKYEAKHKKKMRESAEKPQCNGNKTERKSSHNEAGKHEENLCRSGGHELINKSKSAHFQPALAASTFRDSNANRDVSYNLHRSTSTEILTVKSANFPEAFAETMSEMEADDAGHRPKNNMDNQKSQASLTSLDDGHYSVLNTASLHQHHHQTSPSSSKMVQVTTIISCTGTLVLSHTNKHSRSYETRSDSHEALADNTDTFPPKMNWLKRQVYRMFKVTKEQKEVHQTSKMKLVKRHRAKIKMMKEEQSSDSGIVHTDSMNNHLSLHSTTETPVEKMESTMITNGHFLPMESQGCNDLPHDLSQNQARDHLQEKSDLQTKNTTQVHHLHTENCQHRHLPNVPTENSDNSENYKDHCYGKTHLRKENSTENYCSPNTPEVDPNIYETSHGNRLSQLTSHATDNDDQESKDVPTNVQVKDFGDCQIMSTHNPASISTNGNLNVIQSQLEESLNDFHDSSTAQKPTSHPDTWTPYSEEVDTQNLTTKCIPNKCLTKDTKTTVSLTSPSQFSEVQTHNNSSKAALGQALITVNPLDQPQTVPHHDADTLKTPLSPPEDIQAQPVMDENFDIPANTTAVSQNIRPAETSTTEYLNNTCKAEMDSIPFNCNDTIFNTNTLPCSNIKTNPNVEEPEVQSTPEISSSYKKSPPMHLPGSLRKLRKVHPITAKTSNEHVSDLLTVQKKGSPQSLGKPKTVPSMGKSQTIPFENKSKPEHSPGKSQTSQQQQPHQTCSSHSQRRYSAAQVKTAKILLLVTVVYILSFAPALLMTLSLIPSHPIPFYGYFIHSAANPIIYSFINQTFRMQLKNLFRCRSR